MGKNMIALELRRLCDQIFAKIEPWMGAPLLALEYVIFCVYAAIKQRGGIANYEIYLYLPAHLNAKSVIANMFDARTHDSMGYQNRNLSFLVDYWDALFAGWSLRMGYPHFLSLTYFIGVGLVLWGLWVILRKMLGLDRVLSFLLCTLLLLTPVFQISVSLMRSAKIGATLGVVLMVIFTLGVLQNRLRSPGALLLLWIGTLASSFFDFLSLAFCVYFGILSLVFLYFQAGTFRDKDGRMKIVAFFFGSILVANQAFGRFAVPPIHEHYFGDRYFFAPFPASRVFEFFKHPLPWIKDIGGNFVDQIRFFFGSFPFAIGLLGTILLLWAAYHFAREKFGARRGAVAMGAWLIPLFGIFVFLKIGHDPIFHELFRRLYYPLPFQILIVVSAALLLRELVRECGPAGLKFAKVFLWIAVLGSASSVDGHVDAYRGSYLYDVIKTSPRVLSALRTYVRAKSEEGVEKEILENGLYRFLKEYADRNR